MPIRILVADDHRILREGLRSLLESQDLQVVGEAENGREALCLARELKPDVVLLDLVMPELNGIEACRQIVSELPGVKVVALSMHADRRFVVEALKAGASGYILKDCAFQELERAIRTVLSGHVYLGPAVAGVVVEGFVRGGESSPSSAGALLSPREREVLQLLTEGKGVREIGELLHLSVKTVETHRQRIMKRLGIYTLPELTKFAIREGFTTLGC